jgi:phosphohistidine phosphatase
MKLYLVRHGDALAEREDPSRSLSSTGQSEIERLAKWLADAHVSLSEIRHSTKNRAAQTTRIIAEALAPQPKTREVQGLAPNDDFRRVAEDLVHEEGDLMLVGHLPFVGLLGSLLLKGSPDAARVSFPTGGMLVLERTDDRWKLEHVIDPHRLY